MGELVEDTLWEKPYQEALDQLDWQNIPEQPKSTLVHNDYREQNIMTTKEGEVTGVIDLDSAMLGDRLYDLVRSQEELTDDSRQREAFLDGYRHNQDIPGNIAYEDNELMDAYHKIYVMKSAEVGACRLDKEDNPDVSSMLEWENHLLQQLE